MTVQFTWANVITLCKQRSTQRNKSDSQGFWLVFHRQERKQGERRCAETSQKSNIPYVAGLLRSVPFITLWITLSLDFRQTNIPELLNISVAYLSQVNGQCQIDCSYTALSSTIHSTPNGFTLTSQLPIHTYQWVVAALQLELQSVTQGFFKIRAVGAGIRTANPWTINWQPALPTETQLHN